MTKGRVGVVDGRRDRCAAEADDLPVAILDGPVVTAIRRPFGPLMWPVKKEAVRSGPARRRCATVRRSLPLRVTRSGRLEALHSKNSRNG